MSHALVRGLRAHGADVRTALEEGMIERDDEEHLEFAAKANRVVQLQCRGLLRSAQQISR